jgi:hypothetical protein
MEAEFMNMFYDMLRDNPEEFRRRKELLSKQKKEIWDKMVSCQIEINNFRADSDEGWPELYNELYSNYNNSKLTGVMNLADYCDIAVRHDKKFYPIQKEVMRVHSKVWYVSMLTDDYVRLNAKYQKLRKQKEFDGSLYTFEDDTPPFPFETEKRIQPVTPPTKEVTPAVIEVKSTFVTKYREASKAEPIPKLQEASDINPIRQQPVLKNIVETTPMPTIGDRIRNIILKLVDMVDPD